MNERTDELAWWCDRCERKHSTYTPTCWCGGNVTSEPPRVRFDPNYSKCPDCGDLPDEAVDDCSTCDGMGVLLADASAR